MFLFVDLQVDYGTAVHFIFEVVLSHESGDEVAKIVFRDADLIWYVCDHQSPHFFGVSQGGVGDCGKRVHPWYPRKGIPELPVVIILITSVVSQRRS